MADHNPRPMGFVSSISDTDVKDKNEKDHNPLHHAAHYLKNAVTLESKSDERRRESVIADHAHVNDHGMKLAEEEFWDKHAKPGTHGHGAHGHAGHGEVNEIRREAKAHHGKDGKAPGSVTGTMM